MTCDCIAAVNEKLVSRNTCLRLPIMLNDDLSQATKVMIETEQLERGRGKPKAIGLFATFCPFCGTSYGSEQG